MGGRDSEGERQRGICIILPLLTQLPPPGGSKGFKSRFLNLGTRVFNWVCHCPVSSAFSLVGNVYREGGTPQHCSYSHGASLCHPCCSHVKLATEHGASSMAGCTSYHVSYLPVQCALKNITRSVKWAGAEFSWMLLPFP